MLLLIAVCRTQREIKGVYQYDYKPCDLWGGRGASFHFVLDLTNESSSLNGVHISEGDVVQVAPGRICLLRTSFEGRPAGTHLVTSDGTSVPYEEVYSAVTRAGSLSFNYRFVMPDEDVFCNKE